MNFDYDIMIDIKSVNKNKDKACIYYNSLYLCSKLNLILHWIQF